MAPIKSKKNKTKKGNGTGDSSTSSSSASPFCLEVSNTPLPQLLPGGPYQTIVQQFQGPRNAFEAKTVEKGFYVRVDMPGVGRDSVKVNFEDKKLSFSRKAPKVPPYDTAPRNYHGVITFTTSEPLEVSRVKVDMNNGVLRVVLVGSGFPPHFYAASAHFERRGKPENFRLMEGPTDDVLMVTNEHFFLVEQPVDYVGMYPFQVDGAKGTYELRGINDDYIFYRVDMPDVGTEGPIFRIKDGKVIYGGTGKKASEYDESQRLYMGTFELHCPCACKVVEVHGVVNYGVLRLLMKKERDTGCSGAGSRS